MLPQVGTFAGQLRDRWRQSSPDVVHAYGWICGLAALNAARAAEPFGIIPIEAMACGIPVIASPAGAQRDAVIHGTNGFLAPATDPELLTGRLRQLIAAPMLREGYGIAAASRARARYSWDRIARETLAIYEALPRSPAEV
jgi:glycosyltransferase involved in cell wall biosynthesis